MKSADRGQTWQEASRKGVPDNYLVVTSLAVDPADPRSIVVMWDGKSTWSLFTSADGGATWTKVPPPGGQIPGLSQMIFGASGKTLYAVAKDDRAIRRSVVSLIAGSAERALHPL